MNLARYNWEQRNGPIAKGQMIRFKDGNTLNCDVNNLMLVTRSSNLDMNTGFRNSDNFIASQMAPRSEEMRMMLREQPELLELHRIKRNLKREISNAKRKTA